ncbi:anti-sigma factor family protein [Granulicoccus sp. GXG6511]|uniref:anti-sigma factor family protein n=1 Tax=Granulicoccus sp. GXG6511 TaxID=3381351 RepID=UPI003D7D00F2
MTDQVPGQRRCEHIALEVLADAAEHLLTPDEQQRVETHLQMCPECTELAEALSEAGAAVRELPAPPMPADVLDRLTGLVRNESERRASGVAEAEAESGLVEAAKRTDLGSFRQNPIVGKTVSPHQAHLVGRKLPREQRSEH